MSADVADALRLLDKDVATCGRAGMPAQGTPDEDVVIVVRKGKRLMVTQNHDMVLAAAEEGLRVLYFVGTRAGSFTKYLTAKTVFMRWDLWEAAMADPSVFCLRIERNTTRKLDREQARDEALRRHLRMMERRSRRRDGTPKTQGRLDFA